MTERREFLRTSALAMAAAAVGPSLDRAFGATPTKFNLTTRGGFVRGANDGVTEVTVGTIGRGPWKCNNHPMHAMLLQEDASFAKIEVKGQVDTLMIDSLKFYDLTNAIVTITGYDGSKKITLPPNGNPTEFPASDTAWNDMAYMPTLSMLKPAGYKIDNNWRAKLGSVLSVPCGKVVIRSPFNAQATEGLWDFRSIAGGSVTWNRALTDSVRFEIPLTDATCSLRVDYGYKSGELVLTPGTAGSAISVTVQAADVRTKNTYSQNDPLQHFEMFYTLLENEAALDCSQRVVPIYRGRYPFETGGGTPGDYCPSPWV